MKCQNLVNTKLYEKENKLLKYLLAHQTKALEREKVVPICKKFKSMFDGTVEYFDDSCTDPDYDEEEDSGEGEEDGQDGEYSTDKTEEYDNDKEYEEDNEEDDEDMDDDDEYSDGEPPKNKRKKN